MPAIYLIRHGQASFGLDDYDQLSELGARQSQHLGSQLRERGVLPDQVITGAMQRHLQTAEYCLEALGLEADARSDAAWNEYDHVSLLAAYTQQPGIEDQMLEDMAHGDRHRAFQQHFAKAMARWTSGEHDSDYPESWTAFCQRVETGLQRVVEQASGTVFVFTSGGAIATVARRLLQLPDDSAVQLNWVLANGSLTKLIVGGSGVRLSSLNDHSHFEGVHKTLLSYR